MTRATSTARRAALTFAMTGAVAFGAVALAPAASAASAPVPAVDGGYTIVEKTNGNGPEAFLVTDKGRKPIFFCDAEKPNQRKNNCQADPTAGEGRF